jgi:general secretion pathway protein H
MIVLVIVGVMAGLLVMGFKDSPAQRVRREAGDLVALINAASDEAVMRSIELGLVIDETGYQFVYFDPEKKQWQAARERGLARHDFTETYKIDFALDGAQIDDATRQRIQALAERSEDAALRPTLLILSSGEVTPFRLSLGVGEEAPVTVVGDGLNPVVLDIESTSPATPAESQS